MNNYMFYVDSNYIAIISVCNIVGTFSPLAKLV
jgi:hypothetical protein